MVNVETLAGLMPHLRERLAIGAPFSDEALLASLAAIASHASHEERWSAAETSTLGQYLASRSNDSHRALVTLLSLLPKP
jgi:iron-sulfur cluster repair protein YtfE (RIC family)